MSETDPSDKEPAGDAARSDGGHDALPLFAHSHWMDDLCDRIAAIRERLGRGDLRTRRQVLEGVVEPLLAQLGWEVEHPRTVIRGFEAGSGEVDLALCHPPGTPRILVRIDAALNKGPRQDVHPFDDCRIEALQLEVSAKGREWAIHFPVDPGQLNDPGGFQHHAGPRTAVDDHLVGLRHRISVHNREFARLDLANDPVEQVAKELESLLEPGAVKSGEAFLLAERRYRDRRFPVEAVAAWRRTLAGPAIVDLFAAAMKSATGVEPDRHRAERFVRGQAGTLEWPADPPDARPTRKVRVGDEVWVFDFESRDLKCFRLVNRPVDDDGPRKPVPVTAASAYGQALLGAREGEVRGLRLPDREPRRVRVVLIKRRE